MRAFLWRGPDLKLRGAKVSWEDIACPKTEGGLGIRKSDVWNRAVMAKLIWMICKPNIVSLRVDWVKTYLIRGHTSEISIPRDCS